MFIFLLFISLATIAQTPSYYVERRSYGTLRDTEPPRYVKPVRSWLDLGLDYRLRYEYRDNDFRRDKQVTDNPLLHRTRLYGGLTNILDPFRMGFELSDARRSNSVFPKDNRDVNNLEPLQAFAELYSKAASLRLGRLAFEYLDRRLISRNEWRNTTNTFEGARLKLGQQSDPWQLDVLALRPLIRFEEKIDQPDYSQKFYGAIGDIRQWSRYGTLQPYLLFLQQDGEKVRHSSQGIDRYIQTTGLRAYGIVEKTPFDYDVNYAKQTGGNGNEKQDSHAYNLELGYTAAQSWKPRYSVNYGYASGDKNPNDKKQQRFERLFGFSRPWSNNDYIQMENVKAIKFRTEIEPYETWKIDFGYSLYSLASSKDRWSSASLRDSSGRSGKNIGEEFDIRSRYPLTEKLSSQIGYSYFVGGNFTRETSQKVTPNRTPESHFFYAELTLTAF